jgi:hypothetical protein
LASRPVSRLTGSARATFRRRAARIFRGGNKERGMKDIDNHIPTDAIEKLVDYLWHDEERNFLENWVGNNERARKHIFQSVKTVRKWLDQKAARKRKPKPAAVHKGVA